MNSLLKLFPARKKISQPLQDQVPGSQLQVIRSQYKQGNYLAAITSCNQLLGLDPTNKEAYLLRGFARYKLGDVEGATADIKQAASLIQL